MYKILFLSLSITLFCSCFTSDAKKASAEKSAIAESTVQNTSKASIDTFPKAVGYVNDFANQFDPKSRDSLETKLSNYDEQTTNQISIVTINDTALTTDNFDTYAIDLANNWGVGLKGKNNGLTIVMSPQLRRIRIATGYSTEKILTDSICENVLQTIILPEFKKGNYYNGINKGVDEFIRLWK